MSARTLAAFSTIRTEGAMLPSDILVRVASGDKSLGGLEESSYHLAPGEKIGEATNRAWNRLQAAWVNFQTGREKLAASDTGTTLTRERWLLPLFQLLDYGRLQVAKAEEIGGKSYVISHAWQQTPIHLVGCNVDLDRRIQTAAGGMRSSPHSLLQELLNRSSQHLWGIVSNGLRLRLLRDNISLTRQAYVEFDLEAMMAGEAYPDFVLLWLLLHQSRFEAERESCQLEKWSQAARTEGVRVLDGLRDGVQRAIEHLGQGFLAHPANTSLKENLLSGTLDKQDYYRQLLRLVYRLLFLFVADDRDLLLVPTSDPAAQKRYRDFYGTTRLRRLATTRAGSRHHDLYSGLKLVMDKLSGDGCPELALPALGSFLFSRRALPDLNACDISNLHLLEAVRALAVTQTGQSRRVVDYKNLGAEELGSVYESLLELHPDLNAEAATFELKVAAGSERKKTGSYYTPTSLISCLLDSALDPLLQEAGQRPEPEAAILNLKVVDPACGSGHFLIAAAHRIAKRLAAVRTGEEEPPPEAQRRAIRDVIGHCIYGVDVNPMAVELCKVSLWMEALEPGKPLSFLEHRIKPGNSLLGATPALLAQGIPDEAFTPIEGDVKEICKEFKRINKDERNKQMRLFAATTEPWEQLGNFAASLMNLDTVADDSIEAIRAKECMYEEAIRSGSYLDGCFWADTWCAAFVWKKTHEFSYPITEEVFRRIERNPHACESWMRREIERLAEQYSFFHWHLAFPDLFRLQEASGKTTTGWSGGFDLVLGNPPWERIKLQEKEWFAVRSPVIANAPNANVRAGLIKDLATSDPRLYSAFTDELRRADGETQILRRSGQYPLCGKGDLNTYSVFAERMATVRASRGAVGCIVPPGIALDDSNKEFIQFLIDSHSLVCFYDFTNRGYTFPGVESTMAFSLLVFSGNASGQISLAAQLWNVGELADPSRRYTLTLDQLRLLNPNTRNLTICRSATDAELLVRIYRTTPVIDELGRPDGNKWKVEFGTFFHMSMNSDLFITQADLAPSGVLTQGNRFAVLDEIYVPLIESKFTHQYNHRHSTFEGMPAQAMFGPRAATAPSTIGQLNDPSYKILPRYWVRSSDVERKCPPMWRRSWLIGYRRTISAVADARSVVCSVLPREAVGDSVFLMFPDLPALQVTCLIAILNSFLFDHVARQKASGANLSFYVMRQLPVPPPDAFAPAEVDFVASRVLELTFTATEMQPFAADLGYSGAPFRWNPDRRFVLRCELDALCFRKYGLSRAETEHVLDSFPVFQRRDEQQNGEYRTKRVILEIFDAMAEAERAGSPYQTRLDPPPADPRVAHPVRGD